MSELNAKKQQLHGFDAFFIRGEISGHVVHAEGQRTAEGRWEVYIKENGAELSCIQSWRGKNFVMRMTRHAISGCLSHIGKRGRMAENKRAANEAKVAKGGAA